MKPLSMVEINSPIITSTASRHKYDCRICCKGLMAKSAGREKSF